jgi:transposase
MEKLKKILKLHHVDHLSNRKIAKTLHVSHPTVAFYLKHAKEAGISWPVDDGLDDNQLKELLFGKSRPKNEHPGIDLDKIHLEMKKKHVTLELLWLEYRESAPDGLSYSRFCELYRDFKKRLGPVMRFSHKAGEKMFVDFAGDTIPIYNDNLKDVEFFAELYVSALGASSYLYAEALYSQKLIHFITAMVHALEFYGGLPELLVVDNLRAAVKKANRYEPDLNATFEDMAGYYGVAIMPARPYKPRDKAKAEAAVLLAERWILARIRNAKFTSLVGLNNEIRRLVEIINDKPFKRLEHSRKSLFDATDKLAMKPLPASRYEIATYRKAKVSIDYHIEVRSNRHYYSVPYRLVGELVHIRITASTVEVFHLGKRVASHVRSYSPGFTTDPDHMSESHKRYAEWTPEKILSFAEKVGPATATFISEALKSRPHLAQGFRSSIGVIRLANKYGDDRLENACKRAIHARSYRYRSVESILKNGLDRQPLPGGEETGSHPVHENIRGGNYYK